MIQYLVSKNASRHASREQKRRFLLACPMRPWARSLKWPQAISAN